MPFPCLALFCVTSWPGSHSGTHVLRDRLRPADPCAGALLEATYGQAACVLLHAGRDRT